MLKSFAVPITGYSDSSDGLEDDRIGLVANPSLGHLALGSSWTNCTVLQRTQASATSPYRENKRSEVKTYHIGSGSIICIGQVQFQRLGFHLGVLALSKSIGHALQRPKWLTRFATECNSRSTRTRNEEHLEATCRRALHVLDDPLERAWVPQVGYKFSSGRASNLSCSHEYT